MPEICTFTYIWYRSNNDLVLLLTCMCIYIVLNSFMVFIIHEIHYVFSLGQYWENSPIGGYSFDCIESMVKFLSITEIVPYGTVLKLNMGWKGVDRNCLCPMTERNVINFSLLLINLHNIWSNGCYSKELHFFCIIQVTLVYKEFYLHKYY